DMDLSNKAVKNSENKESVRAIILNGWERKFKVPRHNNTTGKDEYFSPFGLKIMSSYYATSFSAYENRCLNIDVWETERNDIIINTDVKFLKDALHIRNMLLDFKLKNANADFSKYNAMTFKDFGSNVSRRVCQATAPLMRLELFEPTIREYLLSLAMQRNLDEISRNVGTDEGKFFKLYLDILIETCDKDITTNRIKELLPEFYKDWRMDTINNRFKQLGFEIQKKKPDRGRINYHIIFDKKTIFKLIQKYVLPEDRTDDDGHTLNDQIESISTVSEENQQENDQNQEKHGKHENGFQQRRID
ncbi:MAG: hypothetical protein IMZ52_00880, partial [Actinobacteria bacterium]|nr:hypothetical protein [Actinomycetota bacterium]